MTMLVYKCEICEKIGGDEERPFHTPICCGQEKVAIEVAGGTASVNVMQSYQSPVTGKWIDTPRQRRQDLSANGSRPWEGMESEKKESARKNAYEEATQDKKLDEVVRTAYAQLPTEKKAQLTKELGG